MPANRRSRPRRSAISPQSFLPEALEPRKLLAFTTGTDDFLSGVLQDEDHSSSHGPAQIGAVVQSETDHEYIDLRVRNDGPPGEAFSRAFLSLDRILDQTDTMVYRTDPVFIQNGDRESILSSNESSTFRMPELPASLEGRMAYSIVQILDVNGTVQQTLVSETASYVHPSPSSGISIVDPDYDVRRQDMEARGGSTPVSEGFGLGSSTNREDPTRLFAGSTVSITGGVTLAARSIEDFLRFEGEDAYLRTADVTVSLVGLDGESHTIMTSSDVALGVLGRRARRGGGVGEPISDLNSVNRFHQIELSQLASGSLTLPQNITPGAKFMHVSLLVEGQGELSITTERPDVFISDGSTTDLRWEYSRWIRYSDEFFDPAGPGILDEDYGRGQRGDDGELILDSFDIRIRSADAGRVEEVRLPYLVRDDRIAFALVPASSATTWDPATAIAIAPAAINSADASDAFELNQLIERNGTSDPDEWHVDFRLESLDNASDLRAGEYRVAVLILDQDGDDSNGPISSTGRYSTNPADANYTNNLLISNEVLTLDQSIPSGGLREPTPADEFIESFRAQEGDIGSGIAGDAIVDQLLAAVPAAAYSTAFWTAENYWFQDSNGDVHALWHGGYAHELGSGEHVWFLNDLASAAGISGTVRFAPGSMSGVITPWTAFSIQGTVGGQLVSLWWSPEAQQNGSGLNGNGWNLTRYDASLFHDPVTLQPLDEVPSFRSFSESQSNGRFTYDPTDTPASQGGGFSITLVDIHNNVWVSTFTTHRADGTLGEGSNVWRFESLDDVPSIERLGLLGSIESIRDDIRERAEDAR